MPHGIAAARNRPFLDLMDPKFGIAGPSMPEQIESLALGPDLPDERRVLLVTVDNDMKVSIPNTIWAFGIEAALLRGVALIPASD